MDIFLKLIPVFIEIVILAAIIYSLLSGAWLTLFDLGIEPKYKKAIAMVLILIGGILVIFFIAHLTQFYPTLQTS